MSNSVKKNPGRPAKIQMLVDFHAKSDKLINFNEKSAMLVESRVKSGGGNVVDLLKSKLSGEIVLLQNKVNFLVKKKHEDNSLQQVVLEHLSTINDLKNKLVIERDSTSKLKVKLGEKEEELVKLDEKLKRLTEPIMQLRLKVEEQENLKEQLSQVTGECSSLHVVNEEIKKDISDLNEKHRRALELKDKEIESLKQNAEKVFADSKKTLEDKVILEKTKTNVASRQSKIDREALELKDKEIEILKQNVEKMRAESRRTLDDKVVIEKNRIDVASRQSKIDRDLEEIHHARLELSVQSEALDEMKQRLVEDKRTVEEEKAEIMADKIDLDNEWGEIMKKKSEYAVKNANLEDILRQGRSEEKIDDLRNAKVGLQKEEFDKLLKSKDAALFDLQAEIDNSARNFELRREKYEKEGQELRNKLEDVVRKKRNLKEKHISVIDKLKDANAEASLLKGEFNKKFDDLKNDKVEISLQKENLDKQLKSKNVALFALQEGYEKEVQELKNKLVLNKNGKNESNIVLKQKEEEIAELKTQIMQLNFVGKRKLPVEEELSKRFKSSNEEVRELPSIAEVASREKNPLTSNKNKTSQLKKAALEVRNESEVVPNDEEIGVNISKEQPVIASPDVKNDTPANILIDQFNSFIKDKSKELITNDAPEVNDSSWLRDVFEDSDESDDQFPPEKNHRAISLTVNEGVTIEDVTDCSDDNEPFDLNPNTIVPVVGSTPPRPELSPPPSLISQKPIITVRDIDTLSSLSDTPIPGDVLIPSLSMDISDDVDISEECYEESEIEAIKIKADTENLKLKVAEVVSKCLDKFDNSSNSDKTGIQSRIEVESIYTSFSKQFKEDIEENYLLEHSSLAGVKMTKEAKSSIVDQIIFYFEVKLVVDKTLKKYCLENSDKFNNSSLQYSQELCAEIKESYKMLNNTLAGISKTPDHEQWIEDQIHFRFQL